ncbi:MAG: hypothetical protein AMQ22_00564 [Candidatus Methanofastidiosum methylothiophilum]|uniref:Uncharacterized protein n=1 Tax=Candidatus Methanofastidiosum methylothiophilum TaxID=1705564 RepID=A0A150J6J9_9EURY|nr:MAG: hypothetical protein AMQ22_00564 [Candidatus Methanofastidiosum methylthiophilus]
MKKIFALLISLLFVASVFGVAQTMAEGTCKCDGTDVVLPGQVEVGKEFIFKYRTGCDGVISVAGGGNKDNYITQLGEEWTEGEMTFRKYRALRPGTLNFCPFCEEPNCVTLHILPNSHPMQQFMKILGFGKKK